MSLEVRKLSLENFADYESLTSCQNDGGCYCSFWHQKWSSMADWEKCQRETPEINRSIILEKVKSHFHIGVLVYEQNVLIAWVSVGPIIDFYWTWRRVGVLGDAAKTIAGIVCFTIAKNQRNKGRQKEILEALKTYGKAQGWTSIEGYPFDEGALEKHKEKVVWPGVTKSFAEAGFKRTGPHWLSQLEAERSIYECKL